MTKNYNQRKRKFEHVQFEDGNSHHMDHKVIHKSHIEPFFDYIDIGNETCW